ncbi:DUF3099 domain-containing protein [Microbacterium sp. CFH 31415]|uniref:DUF3099 domain-containing protein n=1 Tax=Microbacterium sp. CFH 31415 TaxID=2921732 RepID=UPI001F12BB1F|nr:DUF3099 domain-containing protein [Microbacterium sp. CFH 31415]MCH6229475.1 DUF3099 domain-containing protein [Microbacterium sp. CFH 31415]
MKSSSRPQSATSLPRAPRDDVDARSTRYLLTMGVRVACFILMVVITPYGWYTWVFGAAAIFLPYIAVVLANVGQEARRNRREDPERALPAAPAPAGGPRAGDVIRIDETPAIDGASPASAAAPPSGAAEPDTTDDRPDGTA